MELMKCVNEYHDLKVKMEKTGLMYGLCDTRTIKYSQKLDLLLNKIMKIKYPENRDEQIKLSKIMDV